MPKHAQTKKKAEATTADQALEQLRHAGDEADVGTAMRVFEQAEKHYYGAVATTTPRTHFVTRADTI